MLEKFNLEQFVLILIMLGFGAGFVWLVAHYVRTYYM